MTLLPGATNSIGDVAGVRVGHHARRTDGWLSGTTVVPVSQPSPVRVWCPTRTPDTSRRLLVGPGRRVIARRPG